MANGMAMGLRLDGSSSRVYALLYNSNLLADEELVDPISGTAVLNGIPIELAPVAQPAASSSSRLPNGSVV